MPHLIETALREKREKDVATFWRLTLCEQIEIEYEIVSCS